MQEIAITDLSKNEVRTLWESGVPLDSAWVEFSDSLDDFKWAALRTPPRKYQVIRDDPRYQQLEGWLPKTWKDRQYKLDITRTVERANLLGRIYTGHLWAIGSQTLDNGFDELVRVPRELFFVDIERDGPFHDGVYWAKGQLTMDDESYFDIRIVEAPDSADKESASRAQQEDTSAEQGETHSGRPNTEKQICETVEQAWTTDPDFRALPDRQAQAAEVRARLLGEDARDAHDTVGYSTNTIKRIIGQVVKRLGKAE